MKKKITNNLDLKILALFFSVILWLIVVNIDDPVKTVTFSGVEVKILNGDELTKKGQVYEVLEDTGVVSVTIKGRRSVIEDISKENIRAVADMEDLTSMSTISIVVTTNKYSNEIDDIKCDIPNVKLNIEDLKKIQRSIHIEVLGTPEDNYIKGDLTSNVNQVYLEGPESLINEISEVKAQLQIDDVTNNVSSSVPLKIYDVDGKEIKDERISMNISSINVNQEILYTKALQIRYAVSGKPAEGYAATGEVYCDTETVLVAGRRSILDSLETITVPPSALNLDGVSADLETTVKISQYLPLNVELADPEFDGMVTFKVDVEREVFAEFTFDRSDITVVNLPNGYKAEILTDGNYITENETKLKAYGLSKVLDEINFSDVKMTLDFGAYMREHGITSPDEGIYNLTPVFNLPEGVSVRDNFKVQVRITKEGQ